jgi:lipopolysaccharide export system protein LptA
MSRLPASHDRLSDKAMSASRPSLGKLALRGFVAGALASSAAALGFASLAGAQSIAGFNSNQPVDFDADRIELQDRQDRVVFSGNVVIRQGDLRLTADRTTVAYRDQDGLTIERVDASGGVTVSRGTERATGAAAVYDLNRRIIVLSGGVTLNRGGDTLNGGRLVIDLNTGLSSVDGQSAGNRGENGRVSGTFSVPNQD